MWFFSSASSDIQRHVASRNRALCLQLPANDQSHSDPPAAPTELIGSQILKSNLSQLSPDQIELQPGDEEILRCDIAGLTQGIKNRQFTSTRVLCCFIRAARRAQRETNCLTEVCFESALARAAELDSAFASTGELVGPLHGVPISFKDQFQIKGTSVTLGYSSWLSKSPSSIDSSMVLVTSHLGGIPFVKTNVPQTMLSFECRNPLWGQTSNPYSKNHTCGGSSGGESALLAADGSSIGFGSDIGGSLRIPVGFCGLYSIKPSGDRWPSSGTASPLKGFHGINVSYAPIARSAADLELMTRLVLPLVHPSTDSIISPSEAQSRFNVDTLIPSPLRPAWFNPLEAAKQRSPLRRTIRIGYYFSDGLTTTSPACIRAMELCIEALEKSHGKEASSAKEGNPSPEIELVKIDPRSLMSSEAAKIFLGLTSADGFDGLTSHLKKDRLDPSLFLAIIIGKLPGFVRRMLIFVFRYILRDRPFSQVPLLAGRKSAKKYYEVTAMKEKFVKEWEERIWNRLELDTIICPVQAIPAVPHGGCTSLSLLAVATFLHNVLDSTVAILPVCRVDPLFDSLPPKGKRPGPEASSVLRATWQKFNATTPLSTRSKLLHYGTYEKEIYDALKMKGLPVGVQVVCKPYEDEKAIGMMRLLDDALASNGRNDFGPGTYTSWAGMKKGQVQIGVGGSLK